MPAALTILLGLVISPTPSLSAAPLPAETPTPTVTLAPTATPTATLTPSPTATPTCEDAYEPNETPGEGPALVVGEPLSELTLTPLGDADFFQIWVKAGRRYQIDTATVDGVDTRLRLFNAEKAVITENDDHASGSPASRITFRAEVEGWLFVGVDSLVPINWHCRFYNVSFIDLAEPTPTPTGTSTPSATPPPSATPAPSPSPAPTETPLPALYDAYEPNYDFAHAAGLGVGQTVALNFHPHPPGHPGVDNDFFRLYVKEGQELLIETTALAPGVDTNLILFRADETTIAGNDDCEPGLLRSCLTWPPDYTGFAYLVIGPVGLPPAGVSEEALDYQLAVVDLTAPPTPAATPALTPSPGLGQPAPLPTGAATPPAGEDLPWPHRPPAVTKEPALRLETYPLTPATPTPRPVEAVVIEMTIYYDKNDNQAPDLNEGVAGVSLQALDKSNRILGQTLTNKEGYASLFVSGPANVRMAVPYLGYSRIVKAPGGVFEIRIPAVHMPSLIP